MLFIPLRSLYSWVIQGCGATPLLGYAWRTVWRGSKTTTSDDFSAALDDDILLDLHAELLQRLGAKLQPRVGRCASENLTAARSEVFFAADILAELAARVPRDRSGGTAPPRTANISTAAVDTWELAPPEAPVVQWPISLSLDNLLPHAREATCQTDEDTALPPPRPRALNSSGRKRRAEELEEWVHGTWRGEPSEPEHAESFESREPGSSEETVPDRLSERGISDRLDAGAPRGRPSTSA